MKIKYFFIFLTASFFSCTPLLHVTTTADAKQKWKQHKKIAIIPFKITAENNQHKPSVKKQIEEQEIIKNLSFSVQHNIYIVLQNQYNLSNLSVSVEHPDFTTKLLAQSGIIYGNTPQKNINTLCQLLQVDAVITGTIDFSRPGLSFFSLNNFDIPIIEKAEVEVNIYDKDKIAPIWTIKDETNAKAYNQYYKRAKQVNGSNEEYLIAYMFDKAMKALPYVLKSPLKRFY